MNPIIKNISQLTFVIAAILIVNEILTTQAATKKSNLDSLCNKFPLNSRCEDYDYSLTELEQTKLEEDYDYSLAEPEQKILEIERESLCTKFPQNSNCLEEPLQVLKVQLNRSGENDEWIRMEKQDNTIKILHTTRVKNDLTSGILDGALGFVPVPLPFIELNNYNWKDHQVTSVTFQPDGCQSDICTVTGIDTLILPEGTDLYAGLLTVNYQEGELGRAVTLRVPTDVEKETVTTVTISTPDPDAWVQQQRTKSSFSN
ncbi:hypothetical protein [Pleurocapsa sp. PCC 7319]|uniref:hypothetical protein n=1 Tax=Pleurocapsa sp. PCC 7319 TaxID=118161 RepID=UPI00034AF9F1|nr:hypothetical protein [Pleurocapsa sp. PCC 7319]